MLPQSNWTLARWVLSSVARKALAAATILAVASCADPAAAGEAAPVAVRVAVAAEGVAPADTMKLMDFFNAQGIVTGRGRRMAAGDFEATFELTMARKDVGLMVETAGPLPLALLPALAARMEALIAAGHGQQDLGVLAADAIAAARAY